MKHIPSHQIDAIKFLKADHKEVSLMFEKFENRRMTDSAKHILADEICNALKVHSQIEEEILYPEVRKAFKKADLPIVYEAEVEHGSIKDLISDIESGIQEELFDSQVYILSEWVRHHVNEEENEMFPKLKDSKIDLNELGRKLAKRKEELTTGIIQQTKEWVKSKIAVLSTTADED